MVVVGRFLRDEVTHLAGCLLGKTTGTAREEREREREREREIGFDFAWLWSGGEDR